MRTLLYVIALLWGAAILYQGLAAGLPTPPLSAKGWGSLAGFGFGALLALVGLHHVWQRLTGDDAALRGSSALIVVVLAVAVTAGAMAWRGRARGPDRECDAVLQHLHTLTMAWDPSPEGRLRFEAARPLLLRSCRQMPSEQRQCPLNATSIEEVKACP